MAQLGNLSAELETLNQVLSLVEAFRAFDADNDGCITAAELGGIMGSLGYNASDQDVRAMMQQGDTNKDGLLSLTEFMELNTKNLELGTLSNSLRTAFEGLDLEFGDDDITAEELFEVAENIGVGLSRENCEAIVAAIDADGDGAVNFHDLKVIINSLG